MPIFNLNPKSELPKSRGIESSEAEKKRAKEAASTATSEGTVRNEPASDPWVIGSSIVRRNEPDDED